MLNLMLANFYQRDLRQLIEEVNLFTHEEDLWKIHGSIKNSSGNLVLHLIGGMNYHIGANIAQTGYIRDRPKEFTLKDVPGQELVAKLEDLILLITGTLNNLSPQQMDADYPVMFDGMTRSNSYLLVQLALHLNYHLGQVNYLRRMLE